MAGSDFQATAGQAIDNASAQALHDAAQSGASQTTAFQNAQAQNAAAKTSAIQAAMQYAALRCAPAANADANTATATQPFADRAAALAMTQANYGANNDAAKAALSGFFQGAKAGLPIADANLKQTIANDQEKAAEKQMALQSANETHQLALELARERLASQQAKTDSPASIIKGLGGDYLVGEQLNAAGEQANRQGIASGRNPAGGMFGIVPGLIAGQGASNAVSGSIPGVPASLGDALRSASSSKDQGSTLTLQQKQATLGNTQQKDALSTGTQAATSALMGGESPADVMKALVAGGLTQGQAATAVLTAQKAIATTRSAVTTAGL